MNRRNFILGLGTAATLSGAASVTSAALSGSTEAGADFRVISDEQLNVFRNSATLVDETNEPTGSSEVDNSTTGFVNTSDEITNGTEGSIDFDGASDSALTIEETQFTVDNGTNADLNMSLSTLNTNGSAVPGNRNTSFGGSPRYSDVDLNQTNGTLSTGTGNPSGTPILTVENTGSSAATVGIEYTYGNDVDGSNIGYDTINTLFTFVDNDGDVISPTPDVNSASAAPAENTTIPAGGTEDIGLILNYSDSIANEIADATFNTAFGGSAVQNADLLNIVEFGLDN